MAVRGWITLSRKIQDHWLWQKNKPFDYRSAWIDLLLTVNHEDKKIPFDGQVIMVKRGSTVTSIRKLSVRWGWSVKRVSTFLNLLEQDKMLEQKRNTRCTTLTIVKYGDYQNVGNTKETLKKQSRNTRETLGKTNNNDITMNNNDNKKDISPPASEEQNQYPEGVEFLSDGTVSYANVKRVWD